jgi:transposase
LGANRVAIAHATLHAGDQCPECRRGKVYRQKESATLVRFVGQAPLEATVFEMERLRCNACGEVFTADEPDAAGPVKPATTQWELRETAARPFRPVLEELIRQAAQGSVMHNHDTSMRILQTNGHLSYNRLDFPILAAAEGPEPPEQR